MARPSAESSLPWTCSQLSARTASIISFTGSVPYSSVMPLTVTLGMARSIPLSVSPVTMEDDELPVA
jgi:hypothetical protein